MVVYNLFFFVEASKVAEERGSRYCVIKLISALRQLFELSIFILIRVKEIKYPFSNLRPWMFNDI